MNRKNIDLKKKVLTESYTIAHIFILCLLTSFVFIATPTADDYAYAVKGITNSPIENIISDYLGWGARYSQVLISSVRYHYTDGFNTPYSLWLLLYIASLFLSIFFFTYTFFSPTLTLKKQALIAMIFLTAIIRGLPTLDESIFWEITGTTYVLPSALILLIFTLTYKYKNSLSKPAILLLFTSLIVFASGLNQVVFLILLVFFLGRASYYLSIKCLRKIDFLYILLPLIPGAAILLAPGGGNRMLNFPHSGKLLYSLFYSLLTSLQALAQGLIDPYIWGSIILFLPFFNKISKSLPQPKNKSYFIAIYAIFYFGILYSIGFSHFYGTGERPVQRLMTIWYILFYIGLIPLIFLLAPFLQNKYTQLEQSIFRMVKRTLPIKNIILILTLASFLLINNPPKAVYDLIYNISGFIEDKKHFYKSIEEQTNKTQKQKTLIVDDFQYDPILLKTPTGADYGISSYFGFKEMKVINKNK